MVTPVFVVGTGRSGSTAVANALASSPDVFKCDGFEPKFFGDLSGCHGLFGILYSHKITPEFFRERLATYHQRQEDPYKVGFCQYMAWETFRDCFKPVTALLGAKAAPPWRKKAAAIRKSFTNVVRRIDGARDTRYFIDDTPINMIRLKEILEIFPEARIIHAVRDGRQVAHAHVRLGWAANFAEGLYLWHSRLATFHALNRHLLPNATG
jgi:hypothetical protein